MFHQALGKRNSASVAAVAAVAAAAAAAAGAHEPEAEHPPLQQQQQQQLQQQQQQRMVAPLLCATCHKHRTVCIAGGEGAPLSAAEADSEAALASTAAAATTTDTDSSASTASAATAAASAAAATGQQHVRQANGQPNKQLYAMLEDALRQANSTELHWGFSFGGHRSAATAESAFAAAAAAADSVHGAQSAAAVDVPVAPVPFFPGAFGSLPEAYVGRGRWFAKRVPRGGLLITFLPAFADWCELSSSSSASSGSSSRIEDALNCTAHVQDDSDVAQIEDDELEGRQRQRSNSMPAQDMQPQQQQHQPQQQYAAARSSIAATATASSIDDRTTSSGSSCATTTTGCASGGVLSQQALHVFAFLVRAADFKPRTQALGELHAVRSILLANLPAQLQQQQQHRDATAAVQQQAQQQQHRRADSSSSSSDSSQSDGGQYKQQLLSLHARNFARAAYSALRQGGTLCGQDLSAALSVCSQSATKVDVTLLRRIKLAAQAQQLQLSPGRANANSNSSASSSANGSSGSGSGSSAAVRLDRCDEDFATTMAEYFRPVPGTDLYIYWTDERAVFSAAAEQEEVAAAQIAAEEEEEDEQRVRIESVLTICAQSNSSVYCIVFILTGDAVPHVYVDYLRLTSARGLLGLVDAHKLTHAAPLSLLQHTLLFTGGVRVQWRQWQ
eukprot:1603-Heterococcus_DN1.PRE.2